jgi:glycosyltransferase involved in cell wall biosynthesis
MPKHILHYGNVAGLTYYNSVALKMIGLNSVSVNPVEEGDYKGYLGIMVKNRQLPADMVLYKSSDSKLEKAAKLGPFFAKSLFSAGLVHYYGGTMIKSALDAAIFKMAGKPMIISWAGGDARIIKKAREKNPYFYRENNPEWDKKVACRLEIISKSVRFVVTDCEMAEYSRPYFEKVFILEQPIDLSEVFFAIPDEKNSKPKILHIPTSREVKGTRSIREAIEKLRRENLSFEYVELKPDFTQKQMRRIIGQYDIYVDDLRCGSYGITAVEGMASGKPTVTFIRDDLAEIYPKDLPLVNANPDTVYGELKMLIRDAGLRREIGAKSRKYAEDHHSLEVIGPKLLAIYKEIGFNPPS